jgi:hypothetical protein
VTNFKIRVSVEVVSPQVHDVFRGHTIPTNRKNAINFVIDSYTTVVTVSYCQLARLLLLGCTHSLPKTISSRMAKAIMNWFCLILALSFTKCGIAFASNERPLELPPRLYGNVVRVQSSSSICFPRHGGSLAMHSTNGTVHPGVTTSTSLYAATGSSMSLEEVCRSHTHKKGK